VSRGRAQHGPRSLSVNRSTMERLNKELKRCGRVVGIFPNEASVIRLGGAVLDVHDEWVSTEQRYFSEFSMAKLYCVVDNDYATVGELTPSG
jgi:transposase-like protein